MPPEAVMGNSEAARTPTGELINQSAMKQPEQPSKEQTQKDDTSGTTNKTEPEKLTDPKDGVSLLNEGVDPKAELKPDGEGKEPKKDDAKAGAPEKYELKAPEGFEYDETVLGEATGLFKELGIDNAGAQRLADFYAKHAIAAAEAPINHYMDMRKEWRGQIAADKEIGHKLSEVKATTSKAIDAVAQAAGNPALAGEFRKAMDSTGAGDNPAFIKMFYQLAQMFTEGGHVAGGGPSVHGQGDKAKPGSFAQALYPNLKSSS